MRAAARGCLLFACHTVTVNPTEILVVWCGGFMSDLRRTMTPKDRQVFRLLHFAREYWGKPLKFLTLTGVDGKSPGWLELQQLIRHVRKISALEYLGVRTGEGNGVYHLALMSQYIDQALIREKWESLTGAYHVNISKERSINALVREMTRQQETIRYSMSRSFIPPGSQHALDSLKALFRGRLRIKAYKMLAIRARHSKGDIDQAYHNTKDCISRSPSGLCSDIRTRQVFNVYHIQHASGATYHTGLSRL
jgi:hypothetical protein